MPIHSLPDRLFVNGLPGVVSCGRSVRKRLVNCSVVEKRKVSRLGTADSNAAP